MAKAITPRTLTRKAEGVVNDPVVPGLRWEIGKRLATARISPRVNGEQFNVKVLSVSKAAPLEEIGRQIKLAHQKAWQIKSDADNGIKPAERKHKEKRDQQKARQLTFEAAAERYMQEKGDRTADARERRRKLGQEILPVLGAIPLHDLRRVDVRDYVMGKREQSHSQAINQYRFINAILNAAVDRGEIEVNVAVRLKLDSLKPRDRYLSRDEIRRFWTRLDDAPMLPQTRLILRLLLVTLARRNEVTFMHHDELDRESSTWEIGAERTKSGVRHRIYLTPLAWSLIDAAGTTEGYVFAQPHTGKPPVGTSISQAMKLARPALGIDDIKTHDLRRTGATHLGDMGVAPHVVSRLLGHAQAGVTQTHYLLSLYAQERRLALEAWSSRILEIACGEPAPSNVERLRAAR